MTAMLVRRPEGRRGNEAMRWLGGIFVTALIAITFAVYSDIAMTRCAVGSFFVVLGWCTTYR
jgi:hypothetical protein